MLAGAPVVNTRTSSQRSSDRDEGEEDDDDGLFEGLRLSDEGEGDVFESDRDNSDFEGGRDGGDEGEEEKEDSRGPTPRSSLPTPSFRSTVVPAPLPLMSFGVDAIKYGALTARGQEISAVQHVEEDEAGRSLLQDPLHCR